VLRKCLARAEDVSYCAEWTYVGGPKKWGCWGSAHWNLTLPQTPPMCVALPNWVVLGQTVGSFLSYTNARRVPSSNGHSRSLKPRDRSAVYDFLSVIHSNYGHLIRSDRFEITAVSGKFPLLPVYLTPRWQGSPWNFVTMGLKRIAPLYQVIKFRRSVHLFAVLTSQDTRRCFSDLESIGFVLCVALHVPISL